LEADARGEHTQEDFDAFMDSYGDMFPDRPANLEELVDSLVRRAMAAQRLMASLSPEQRDELAGRMQQTLADAGLAAEMARLADALRARRPELDADGGPGETMTGNSPLDLGDATTALADLADLAELETALRQDYPGARLDDIDEAAVRRALGRAAVDDMEALRQTERELERQGDPAGEWGERGVPPQGGGRARGGGSARPGGRGGRGTRSSTPPGGRASPPAPPGPGSSGTSSRPTRPPPCATRCCGPPARPARTPPRPGRIRSARRETRP